MTPEDEREAQHADQLVGELAEDERHRLLEAWAQYLVDREQTDLPVRHRDFILGWIACYDSHELRPRRVYVTLSTPESPRPQRQPASRLTLQETLLEAKNKRYRIELPPRHCPVCSGCKKYNCGCSTFGCKTCDERDRPLRVSMTSIPD